MAETRKIVIEILGEGETGEKKDKKPDPNKELAKKINKIIHPLRTAENALIAKSAVFNYALQQAKGMATSYFTTSIDRILNLRENYLAQNEYNNFKTGISKATNFLGTTASGVMVGAQVGGVYGAIAGGVIGAVSWGGNQITENRANLSSYYQEINTMNYNTGFSRTRAGLVDGGRGTEN